MCYLIDLPHSSSHELPPAKRKKYEHADGTYVCTCVCCIYCLLNFVVKSRSQICDCNYAVIKNC